MKIEYLIFLGTYRTRRIILNNLNRLSDKTKKVNCIALTQYIVDTFLRKIVKPSVSQNSAGVR